MNGAAFPVLRKAMKISELMSGFNCSILEQFLNFSNLRFNSNVSFEFLCFKWLGFLLLFL